MSERLVEGETPVEFFREQLGAGDGAPAGLHLGLHRVLPRQPPRRLRARATTCRGPSPATTRCRWPCSTCARSHAIAPRAGAPAARDGRHRPLRLRLLRRQPERRARATCATTATSGGHAYARLAHEHETAASVGPAVFSELAGHFREFVDVLSEVSEATRLSTPLSVVRLYERWLQTGSRRAAAAPGRARHHPASRGRGQRAIERRPSPIVSAACSSTCSARSSRSTRSRARGARHATS